MLPDYDILEIASSTTQVLAIISPIGGFVLGMLLAFFVFEFLISLFFDKKQAENEQENTREYE